MNFTSNPALARFTDENIMIKDYHYYKGRDNYWNRPAHINKRIYSYYHQNQDSYVPVIEKMREQEQKDKEQYDFYRKEWLISKQLEDRIRHNERKKEISLIDPRKQPIDEEFPDTDAKLLEFIAKKTNSVKHHRINDNTWNFLHLASRKNLETVITPSVIKGEEKAIQMVQDRINRELEIELKLKERKEALHDKIRFKFLKRQEMNNNFEKTIGVAPQIQRMRNSKSQTMFSTKLPLLTEPSDNQNHFLTKPSNRDPIGTIPSHTEIEKSPQNRQVYTLNKLSAPRGASSPAFNYDSQELNGMLIRNMDENTFIPGDKFYEGLRRKSPVFEDVLEKNKISRGGEIDTSSSHLHKSTLTNGGNQTPIFVTNEKKFKRASMDNIASDTLEAKEANNEINQFTKNITVNKNSRGYPKVALEEAISYSSFDTLSKSEKSAKSYKLPNL